MALSLTAKLRRAEADRARAGAPATAGAPGAGIAAFAESDASGSAERVERLRALIGDVMRRDRGRRHAAPGPPQPLPVGERLETPHGALHVVERYFAPEHHHGRVPVAGALGVDAELVGQLALDPCLSEVDLSRMLFLDTETTGLAGGTGTVAFLVGLAWFEEGALRLEQLFVPGFGEEGPMLRRLAERLAEASCLVSYNGKSFDWPLLRTRFVMNRVPVAEPAAHLDLLHCARRLLRQRMESVRLTAVERELLGFYREGDVDGAEIPGRYTSYLRGGDPELLLPVLEHNDNDLVALAAILSELCARYADARPEDDPADHLACARLSLRGGQSERALAFARAAVDGGAEGGVLHEAHRLMAQLHRRGGADALALSSLEGALAHSPDSASSAEVHLALAKLLEHRLRAPAAAYRHARHTGAAEGPLAQGRRLGRLRRRMER